MTTEELKAELRRREEKHNVKVGPLTVALSFDEMEEVKKQIEPFLKLVPVMRDAPVWPPNITETEWISDEMGG